VAVTDGLSCARRDYAREARPQSPRNRCQRSSRQRPDVGVSADFRRRARRCV